MFIRLRVSPRSLGLLPICIAVLCFAPPVEAQDSSVKGKKGPARQLSPQEVFKKASQSVLLLYAFDDKGKPVAQGSAVVVQDGSLVTNRHVVEDGSRFKVEQGDKRFDARLRFCDPVVDLCMLDAPQLAAPAVTLRQIGDVEIGERVFSIGAPQGLSLTLGEGLISGMRTSEEGTLLQTSAPISGGSSGGGLFDVRARLVGITTSMYREGQNLNFAIPSNAVKTFLGRAALESLVAEHLRARGGREALNAIDSVRMEGRSAVGDLTLPFTIEWKRPDLYRIDTWVGDDQFTRAFDGIDAWISDPQGTKQAGDVNPTDRWSLADSATHFLDQFGDLRSTRPTLDYQGVKSVNGKKVFELHFFEEGGAERTVYLDASSLLEVRVVRRYVIQGKETLATIDLGNHTKVGEIVLPLSAVVLFDRSDIEGVPSRMTMDTTSVETNVPISDSRFSVSGAASLTTKEDVKEWLDVVMNRMAEKGGEFKALQDSDQRRLFLDYLIATNPRVDDLCLPLLRREWSVYRSRSHSDQVSTPTPVAGPSCRELEGIANRLNEIILEMKLATDAPKTPMRQSQHHYVAIAKLKALAAELDLESYRGLPVLGDVREAAIDLARAYESLLVNWGAGRFDSAFPTYSVSLSTLSEHSNRFTSVCRRSCPQNTRCETDWVRKAPR